MSEVVAAFISALAEMDLPGTDSTADTGKFRYPYLSLPGLIAHSKPVLGRHGLAAVQDVSTWDTYVQVTTIIFHTSGGELRFGPLSFPLGPNPQQTGSAITYARRYSLAAALGIAPEEDDDGAAASRDGGASTRSAHSAPPSRNVGESTDGQREDPEHPLPPPEPTVPAGAPPGAPSPTLLTTGGSAGEIEEVTAPELLGEGASGPSFLTKDEQKSFARAFGGQTNALQLARERYGERIRSLGDVTRDMALELVGSRT